MPSRTLFSLFAVGTSATVSLYPVYKSLTFPLPPSRASEGLYSQVPLSRSSNQIRLLSLHPGVGSSAIQCTLRVLSLEDNPRFTALSYTWGEPIRRSASVWSFRGLVQYLRGLWWTLFRRDIPVSVNGVPLYIKHNLASALKSLRHEEEEKVLWVDALCINQQDPIEKADQVARMRDIYSQAHATCVWLGPSEDDSDTAMDFVRGSHMLDVENPKLRLDDINPPWQALQALFARSWWSRMWIVQEFSKSNNVVVRCGEKEVEMAQFRDLMNKEQRLWVRAGLGQFGGHTPPRWFTVPGDHPFYNLLATWNDHQGSNRGPSTIQSVLSNIPFLGTITTVLRVADDDRGALLGGQWGIADWLFLTQPFESSLPRDKIYALLGLIGDEDKGAIIPDYSPEKDDVEIFKEVSAYLLRRHPRLDYLHLAQQNTRILGASPSWVPNLAEPRSVRPSMTQFGFKADGGLPVWARLTPDKTFKVSQQPNGLLDISSWLGKQVIFFLPVQLLLFKWGRPLVRNFASKWHIAWCGSLGLHGYLKFGNRLRTYGAVPTFSSDHNTIHLDGLMFDEIVFSDPAPDVDPYTNEDRLWMERTTSETRRYSVKTRLKDVFRRWEAVVSTFPRLQTSGDHRLVAFRQSEDALWRTLLVDHIKPAGRPLEQAPASMGEAYRYLLNPSPHKWTNNRVAMAHGMTMSSLLWKFVSTANRVIINRALIMTKHGMVGLAPAHAKPGDVICILRGGQTPFVLRPKGTSDDGAQLWELVGDCYVHGIMDGSFALQAKLEDVYAFSIV